ncbi:hypothetical protein [Croceiramulus getboli]|nr:hypothetical protein P8624_10670 [Flavobacteriaceae bacterium YJPT1-3]
MRTSIVVLAYFFAFISCSSDDNAIIDPRIDGKWNLTFVSCECEPVDLEKGQHIWFIDVASGTLTVVDNTTEELHTLPDAGEYPFQATLNTITVFDAEWDYYFRDGNLIVEDSPETDGPQITLKRD